MTTQVATWVPLAASIVVPAYLFMTWMGSNQILVVLLVSASLGFLLGHATPAPELTVAGAITAVWLAYIAILIALPAGGREPIPDVVAAMIGALFAAEILGGSLVGLRLGRHVRGLKR